MIGYTSVGTNNLNAAANFYDALFELFNAKRTFEAEDFIVWGSNTGGSQFSVHEPVNGDIATVGNGVMIALHASTQASVDAIYVKTLTLGALDEGAPGFRMEGFYAAYFRDLDGNKCFI